MNYNRIILFTIIGISLPLKAMVTDITSQSHMSSFIANHLFSLVEFTKPDCGDFCKDHKEKKDLEKMATRYPPVGFARALSTVNPAYNIIASPTYILFDNKGNQISLLIGTDKRSQIEDLIDKVLEEEVKIKK